MTPQVLAGLFLTGSLAMCTAAAQEMEPRAFSASPTGVTTVLAAYGRSTGGILTDPSLPVDDVDGEIDGGAIGIAQTFGLLGRSASFGIIQTRVSGHFTGTLNGENAEASRSGLGDTKLRLAMNLIGGPAMSPAKFFRRKRETTLGASITIAAPIGEYHADKLINVGTNRWAIKPEFGVSHPIGKWDLEATAGVWLFEDNDNFFGGQLREQDPLASLQAHIGYTFRPRLWLAFDAIFYDGGQTSVNGVDLDDRQTSSRYGLTFSAPLSRNQSLKFYWNDGASTRFGSDFTNYGVAWQYAYIGK